MNPKFAIKIMLCLLTVVVLFHFCILLKFIPYEITWGGRLKSDSDMYVFESISIVINLFIILILLIKGNYIRAFIPVKFINIVLWIFLVLFVLNTVGNILAHTKFEKFFSLLTLAFTILLWITLTKGKKLR